MSVIKKFVAENAEKIFAAVDKNTAQTLSFQNGSKIILLGREYTLAIQKSDNNSYYISDESVTFYVTETENYELKKEVYETLLKNTANVIFPKLLEECYQPFTKICASIPELKIKDLRSQWGNCYHKRNLITLNIRLAAYDLNVIRSVVYHEYCHFVYQNHSKDFYNLLTRVCPYWKKCDKILKNKA